MGSCGRWGRRALRSRRRRVRRGSLRRRARTARGVPRGCVGRVRSRRGGEDQMRPSLLVSDRDAGRLDGTALRRREDQPDMVCQQTERELMWPQTQRPSRARIRTIWLVEVRFTTNRPVGDAPTPSRHVARHATEQAAKRRHYRAHRAFASGIQVTQPCIRRDMSRPQRTQSGFQQATAHFPPPPFLPEQVPARTDSTPSRK